MEENIESTFKVKRGNLFRDKPWVVSTFVLGILVILLLVGSLGITGGTVSEKSAGDAILSLANSQGADAELVNVVKEGDFYKVTLSIDGNNVPVYVTKDGKYFTSSLIPLTEQTQETSPNSNSNSNTPAQDIPKSTKPSVELYVFTYCPYGTQSEKGIIPVVELLGDKIDFKIRQIGAMHGEYEKIEAERQLCIEKEYPAKYLDYVLAFALNSEIGACGGEATCVGPKIDALYTKLGISKAKIESCIASDGLTIYNAELSNSQKVGVSGSPTLIINGVKISSARDSASYLDVVCQAFSDGSVPIECGEQLSSASPSAGFGTGTTSGGATAAQC
ncbi:MAG: hypothetical protein AABY32_06025 [Nanoarchaeota archaeon]